MYGLFSDSNISVAICQLVLVSIQLPLSVFFVLCTERFASFSICS